MRRSAIALFLCAINAFGAIGFGSVRAGDDPKFVPLFNGKDLTGWKFELKDPKADPASTFVVKDGEIQISGQPFGYLYTAAIYKNYVVRYSWTYPKDQPEKTTMNSGLLMNIQEPHKVWPLCVEAQGRYDDHGKIFFMGAPKGAKNVQQFDAKKQKEVIRPSYEWNTTEAKVVGWFVRGEGQRHRRGHGDQRSRERRPDRIPVGGGPHPSQGHQDSAPRLTSLVRPAGGEVGLAAPLALAERSRGKPTRDQLKPAMSPTVWLKFVTRVWKSAPFTVGFR